MMFGRRSRADGGGRLSRLTGPAKWLAYMGIGVVVVIIGLIAMIVLGANVDRLPQPGGDTSKPAASSVPTAVEATPGT